MTGNWVLTSRIQGSSTSSGSSDSARCTAARTSSRKSEMSVAREVSRVMVLVASWDELVICSRPSIENSSSSRGRVTSRSTSSGAAPR